MNAQANILERGLEQAALAVLGASALGNLHLEQEQGGVGAHGGEKGSSIGRGETDGSASGEGKGGHPGHRGSYVAGGGVGGWRENIE